MRHPQLPAPSVTALRRQLLAIRNRAVVALARGESLDAGMVSLIGSVAAALSALDHVSVTAETAERVVVVDDGRAVRLRLFRADQTTAEIELDAARAISMAGELIAAARWRLQPEMKRV
jgi:hypothetical protein